MKCLLLLVDYGNTKQFHGSYFEIRGTTPIPFGLLLVGFTQCNEREVLVYVQNMYIQVPRQDHNHDLTSHFIPLTPLLMKRVCRVCPVDDLLIMLALNDSAGSASVVHLRPLSTTTLMGSGANLRSLRSTDAFKENYGRPKSFLLLKLERKWHRRLRRGLLQCRNFSQPQKRSGEERGFFSMDAFGCQRLKCLPFSVEIR
jgi:hypothetical protein